MEDEHKGFLVVLLVGLFLFLSFWTRLTPVSCAGVQDAGCVPSAPMHPYWFFGSNSVMIYGIIGLVLLVLLFWRKK